MSERDDTLREARRLEVEHGASDPYAAAVRATRMPIVIADARIADTPIVFANAAFLALSGYSSEEIIGRNCRFMQGPDTDRAEVARIGQAIKAGESVTAEILNYRKTGEAFWNALYVSPVMDAAGTITHFFGSQLDVTPRMKAAEDLKRANAELAAARDSAEALASSRTRELERALEQKTLLLHEVDHRVKNNLQLISSLILLQSRRIADPEARREMKSLLERVSALASVHRNLFQSDDVSAFDVPTFIRAIAHDLLDATGREDITLDFDLAPVSTPASRAAPIALVVNELLTNAFRHAFTKTGGRVRLAVRGGDGAFEIEIADDGVREPSAETAGFGSSLIDLLSRQLAADVDRREGPDGTSVTVRIPVSAGEKA